MKPQHTIIVIGLLFSVLIGLLLFQTFERSVYFSPDMTLRQFALQNDIKPGRVKTELGMPHARGRATLRELGLDEQKAADLLSHIGGGAFAGKMAGLHLLFAAAVCLALWLLQRNTMNSLVKYALLAAAVTGFGFALGKTYNPMVAMVKTGKGFAGLEANPGAWLMVLALFCLLAIIGTKAVCGWACPYGALQELLFKLPLCAAWKKSHKLPFWLANSIRLVLFALFLAALAFDLFGLRQQGRSLYHGVNPFNLFELAVPALSVGLYIVATLGLSLFFYRPHCYAVCPFGLLSWALERISVFRIRINRQACTACGACVMACPGQAMKGIYERSALPADCFSCGECLRVCAFDALAYAPREAEAPQTDAAGGSGGGAL